MSVETIRQLRPDDDEKGEQIEALIRAGVPPSEAEQTIFGDSNSTNPDPNDPTEDYQLPLQSIKLAEDSDSDLEQAS